MIAALKALQIQPEFFDNQSHPLRMDAGPLLLFLKTINIKSMQKQPHIQNFLCRLMKYSIIQVFIVLVFAGMSLARPVDAQDLLNQKISLSIENKSISAIFQQIEEQLHIRFTYRSRLVPEGKRFNVSAKNEKLNIVLDQLLLPMHIQYKIIGQQIVLSKQTSFDPLVKPLPRIQINTIDFPVKGTVNDENGNPIPGVTVMVRGTQTGTITNTDGQYSLNVSDSRSAIIIFSFVGYVTQELPVNGQSSIDVSLNTDTKALEEVVVVGYGTQQKKDITGAVASVRGDEIAQRKTTQISQALQGTMPGVMVTRNSNAPGATANIRVRGITTITDAGSNPLIILDGVPIDDINSINPNDVESISVLKDAASASIYGSRAAAGVILVTTKRAKNGQVGLDYTVEYGFEKPTQMPTYVSAKRYMELVNELRWNDNGNGTNEYPTYSKDIIDNYEALHKENPDLYPDTDWKSLILKDSAPRKSHILSIYGAGQFIRSRVSLAYDDTKALYNNRNYERLTARINNDITINKFLSASVDINYKRTNSDQPNISPFFDMGIAPPVYAAFWSDGRIASGKDGENVYARLNYGGFNRSYYNQIGGKIGIDFSPIEGLKVSGVFSPFLNADKSKVFKTRIPYTSAGDPNTVSGYMAGFNETTLTEIRNDNYRYTAQAIINYKKQLGDHAIDLMGGYEFYYAFNEDLGASRGQYLLTNYPYLNIGPLELRNNNGSAWENAYRSWFGRAMYNFREKYLLQANIRFDGSSRFAKDYRWGAFPSFSAGWVLSEENFIKSSTPWLSFLKLRASWGTLGNERIGNYPYQAILNFENSSLFYQGNNIVSAQAAAQWQYAIRDISWETTQSTDFGIDAHFLQERLRFSGDYYVKTTKDMLLALEIPDYVGFDNPDQNTGKMFTKGWEFDLGWNDKIGNFGYSASFNLSDFKSKMGDLGGTEFIGDQIKIQGSEFNEWYGYVSEGLFQTQEQLDNLPKLNASVNRGDVRYRDISGPDGVPDGKISPEYDRVLLGGSLPRLMYGFNAQLRYKNWDFAFVLQGVGKQNSRLTADMIQPLRANWGTFPSILEGNTWSRYNSDAENLNMRYPRHSYTSVGNNYALSDYWLINGKYLRIKNINLGYNVPTMITEKVRIKGLRLYASVTDLWTLNKFPKGWDPEMSSLTYPITATYVFGASVKF